MTLAGTVGLDLSKVELHLIHHLSREDYRDWCLFKMSLPSSSETPAITPTAPTASTISPSDPSSDTLVPSASTASNSERIAEAKAAVTASLASVGNTIDVDLQSRARDMHANADAISKQEGKLDFNTAELAKSNAKWKKELDANTRQLNQFGDLQNWAEMLERDILVLEEVVRLKEGRPDEGNVSGTNPPLRSDSAQAD
jgi:hypothetical protein